MCAEASALAFWSKVHEWTEADVTCDVQVVTEMGHFKDVEVETGQLVNMSNDVCEMVGFTPVSTYNRL